MIHSYRNSQRIAGLNSNPTNPRRGNDYDDQAEPLSSNVRSIGVFLSGIVNVALGLFLLWNSAGPIIWGEWIGAIAARSNRLDRLATVPSARREPPETLPDPWQQQYFRFRGAFMVIALLSLVPGAGLVATGYFAMVGEPRPVLTSVFVVMAAVSVTVVRLLGWGGAWALLFLLVALVQTGIAYGPPLVRHFRAKRD
jgi:hypothetical protein